MESDTIIIILLLILIAIYIYDIYRRENFKSNLLGNYFGNIPGFSDLNQFYSPVNYNTAYDNCQTDTGYPLNRPCIIKTNIPKNRNVCNKQKEVIDLNSDYNSLLSIDDLSIKNMNKKQLSLKNENNSANNIDIKSLNSIDSGINTLNDIDEEINSYN